MSILPGNVQILVAFNNKALDDPAAITSVASPAGTLGTANQWTDITPYVQGYQISRGRQHELDQFDAGTVSIDLNNEDGRFLPWNTSSPYAGLLTVRSLVQVRATVGGTTYTRFTGHIDSWGVLWADTATQKVQLHATDAFRLMSIGTLALSSYAAKVVTDGAVDFFPLSEPAGSTTARDSITGNSESVYGTGWAFGVAGVSAVWSATAASLGGAAALPVPQVNGNNVSVEVWFKTTSSAAQTIWSQNDNMSLSPWGYIQLNGAGSLVAAIQGVQVTKSANVTDGNWHHVVVTFTTPGGVGASGTSTLYIDGALASFFTATLPVTNNGPGYLGADTNPTQRTGYSFNGDLQNFAIYNSVLNATQVANHYSRASFPQEPTGSRVGRVLDAVGWPAGARNIDAGVSTVQAVTTSLASTAALQHMQDCQSTEGGALFMTAAGEFRFVNRHAFLTNSLYTTSQATFGDAGGDIPWAPGPVLTRDDIDLYTTAAGSRQGGVSQSWPPVPTADYDQYGGSTWQPSGTLMGISDEEVLNMLQFVVNNRQAPKDRLQSLTVNLLACTAAQAQTVLALDLLYRITAQRSSVPGSAFSQIGLVEHIDETVTPGGWTITLALDTADLTPYWVLGTSEIGVNTTLAY